MGELGWVPVGRLWRTRGNRGELVGEVYSAQPGRAERLKAVRLGKNGRERESVVEELWYHQGRPIFKFAGIDSITDAEAWEGADILVDDADPPGEGEFSHPDLVGCQLVSGEKDESMGVVVGIEEFGGPPLLRVEAADGRVVLIPFANAICREIDVAAKRIRVDLPPGLWEL